MGTGKTSSSSIKVIRFRCGVSGPISNNHKTYRDDIGKNYPVGQDIRDPFFDSGQEELLTTYDIIDLLALHDKEFVTITFNKDFLKKILRSHICMIRRIEDAA